MARLTTIKPMISRIAPRMTAAAATYSPDTRGDWSKLYDMRAWRGEPHGLRWQTLLRDHFTCQMCGKVEASTKRLIGDHLVPHKGDLRLFLDPDNVWCLCASCHDVECQTIEAMLFDGDEIRSAKISRRVVGFDGVARTPKCRWVDQRWKA
ncbi:HNH endonuclease [Paenirhodobacter populi]|uniref:HNH endonuclease n=1 Tax=Paenirhodobacter populi TaxID=2306993 RepID=A0A443J7H4_9RHOB|nr:HNH endonuclease [Sinirhodobacter populi]RWR16426.1 HNH endonuclease [Sinirhodobacter populi]